MRNAIRTDQAVPRRLLIISLVFVLIPNMFGAVPDSAPRAPTLRPIAPAHHHEVVNFLRSRHTGLSEVEVKKLTATILREARRSQIAPQLILGLIHVESSGNPRAVSNVGAMGLMQLRPNTAAAMARELSIPWQGPESLFDPNLNVVLGVHYLTRLIDRFGDIEVALAAYNWGPTRIARALRRGRSAPVRYTESVLRAYTALI
jgi:soluble lytic murein transglycosylase-like protein